MLNYATKYHVPHRLKVYEYQQDATIVLYRNPKEFNYFIEEKINPDHKILIWGRLKKKYRRGGALYIQAGRIILPCVFISIFSIQFASRLIPSFLIS
ncbi:unnamed protein product, partial [marine sediment metagenome]